jgi:hypothetical protein
MLNDGETCCDMNKVTADYAQCCRSYDTPVGNTCCASPQVADNGQTCCASDEEVVNDSCCHWSRASTDEKTKKKVCCPADRTVRENICEIKRCDSTSDIYHPDVAFTDSGYPTLVRLGYKNILCCKGAYGTNGDMLFAHTDGTVDCCPVSSGNMVFVKDPVYGSQGGQNKYTGKYFSLPYGTCEAYVPPVTDEITTTEETSDTDTDTDTDTETSTEWCEYVCESDSPGYNEQACEEFCWWVNDPITNTRGEYYDRCCEPAAMSDNTCLLGQSYEGPTGNKTLGPVTDYCCQAAVDDNRTWWPNGTKVKACGNQCCSGSCVNGVCCLSGGSGATEQGNGFKNNDCNNSCCPSGMACKWDEDTKKDICVVIDIDTITQITEETSIPESSGDDETTAPSGGGNKEEPQEPEDTSLDCSGDAYNPGYYMSKFCACCARNSNYNYYCADCSNPPNSWSDDGEKPEESESEGNNGYLDDEIAQRCGYTSNSLTEFCTCCSNNSDLTYEGKCSEYCEGDYYTRP